MACQVRNCACTNTNAAAACQCCMPVWSVPACIAVAKPLMHTVQAQTGTVQDIKLGDILLPAVCMK